MFISIEKNIYTYIYIIHIYIYIYIYICIYNISTVMSQYLLPSQRIKIKKVQQNFSKSQMSWGSSSYITIECMFLVENAGKNWKMTLGAKCLKGLNFKSWLKWLWGLNFKSWKGGKYLNFSYIFSYKLGACYLCCLCS